MTSIRVPTAERRGLWAHRDFRLLWFGQTISDVGTSVSTVVLPLIAVVYLHATALAVGVLSALEWLPWLLIGLPAGVWVDRSARRPLLVWCDVVRALLLGSIPIAAAFDALTLGQLLAVAFGTGLATVVFQVAYQSYLPILVRTDDLAEGNAKLQGSQAAANVVGPGIGGVLAQAVRAPFALVVDALSYVVSVVALVAIRAPEQPPDAHPERNLRREVTEGAAFVVRDPYLRVLTVAPAFGNFFFIGYEAIVVVFLVRSVHLSAGSVGVLLAMVGLGSILGALLARPVGRWIGTSRALWVAMGISAPFGLLIPLTGRGAGLAFFVIGNLVMLMGILVYNVTISAFRQGYCPPQLLGRVVASMRFVLFGVMPLGALAGGALAQSLGARDAIWVLLAGNAILPSLVLIASPLRMTRDLPVRAA